MKLLLLEHFRDVFAPETVVDEYIRIAALALSGMAQDFRAIWRCSTGGGAVWQGGLHPTLLLGIGRRQTGHPD